MAVAFIAVYSIDSIMLPKIFIGCYYSYTKLESSMNALETYSMDWY